MNDYIGANIDHEPYRKQCRLAIKTAAETAVVTTVIINMALQWNF